MIHIKSLSDHKQFTSLAKNSPEDFWQIAAESFIWKKKWDKIYSGSLERQNIKWFEGASLNITENCIDRHAASSPDKVALIWEPNDPKEASKSFTYGELKIHVDEFAGRLKKLGVTKGDRVCIYMAMVPELMFSVLACARLGAVHCVVFGGFSAHSLATRISDSGAKFVITSDGCYRGAKAINLKDIVNEALEQVQHVKTCIVVKRTLEPVKMLPSRDYWYHEIDAGGVEIKPEVVDAEHPLFILYTSGSTGKPKGLLHTTAGYMVYAAYTFSNVFQTQNDDIFWCTADLGWITGHTYLTYGPLLCGRTTVMFEGVPTWPDPSRFWQVIDRHQVTHFYTAPTAIRSLQAFGLDPLKNASLQSLKVLGSVGEPINEEAWEWYSQQIGKGRTPIVDTWWQTETGGIMISTLAGVTPAIAAHATLPLPGIEPSLMDDQGNEISKTEAEGRLCIKKPWPGMARTVYGDDKRYFETYLSAFPGYYFTGDGAKRDAAGNYRITGRVDDIIIVSGHNIGTAEVEDALDLHPDVVESAVIGVPHPIKGQAIHAFLICSNQSIAKDTLRSQLLELVSKHLGGIAKPEKFQIVPGLPKTRSGKIMRRVLRKVAEGETKDFGDTSTLLNPEIVDLIIQTKSF